MGGITPGGRGPELIAVYSFFVALTTLFIALRVYSRVRLVKNFALDDWLALASWVCFILLCCFAINGAHHGTGLHMWDIKPITEIPIGLKWWWTCEPVYVLSNSFIKASIAVMLLRLTIERVHRLIIWITLVISLGYSTAFFFLFVFQCTPVDHFWLQFSGQAGSCISPQITVNSTYAYSAITCVSDWIFAILPFFLVWKLQMEKRQKYLVAIILAMGAIASTATIIRIPYLSTLSHKSDFLYATLDVAIWSACETGLGITAASAATLRPLFREWKVLKGNSRTRFQGYAIGRAGSNARRSGAGPWPGQDGYVRSPSRGGVGEAQELGPVDKGKIRQTTQVSVSEDYGYGHQRDLEAAGDSPRDGFSAGGSESSETEINGRAQSGTFFDAKPLPGIPWVGRRDRDREV